MNQAVSWRRRAIKITGTDKGSIHQKEISRAARDSDATVAGMAKENAQMSLLRRFIFFCQAGVMTSGGHSEGGGGSRATTKKCWRKPRRNQRGKVRAMLRTVVMRFPLDLTIIAHVQGVCK
jgi:hypothetical protein